MARFADVQHCIYADIMGGWVRKSPKLCWRNIRMVPTLWFLKWQRYTLAVTKCLVLLINQIVLDKSKLFLGKCNQIVLDKSDQIVLNKSSQIVLDKSNQIILDKSNQIILDKSKLFWINPNCFEEIQTNYFGQIQIVNLF